MKDRIITWISAVVILIGVIVSSAGLDQAWWTGSGRCLLPVFAL